MREVSLHRQRSRRARSHLAHAILAECPLSTRHTFEQETTMDRPTPDKVMQLITGTWAASILGAAARHGLFTVLEGNPDSTDGVAKKASISPRGAQALLDGLTGLGLVTLSSGKYQNTPDASAFLVKGKPSYMGALADVLLEDFGTWQKL